MLKKFFKRATAAFAALTLAVGVSACSVSPTQASFNTAELAKDAAAAAFLAQTVDSLGLLDKMNATDKATFLQAVNDIKTTASEVAANTNGNVSIEIGNGWAKALAADASVLLKVAEPVVRQYAPNYVSYITTAQALIPLLQALIVGAPSSASVKVAGAASPIAAPMVRARIYQGA